MDNRPNIFSKLLSSPLMLLKAVASLVFITVAIYIFVQFGVKDLSLFGFGCVIFVYGIWRFYTFYADFKRLEENE